MLTPMQKVAIIILLFKKGDHYLLSNFKLISLTNGDYKILAYILSNHLNDHLSDVIAVNQTVYILGRFIGTNIWSVQDTMDYFAKHSLPSLILFLDFKKAFDSVSYSFLFALLHHIGLPEEFIVWVKIMYHEVYSNVRHNNWLMMDIHLMQGVRVSYIDWDWILAGLFTLSDLPLIEGQVDVIAVKKYLQAVGCTHSPYLKCCAFQKQLSLQQFVGVPGTFIPNPHLPIVMKKLLKDDFTIVLTLDKWCVFFNRVSFEIPELEQIFRRMLVQCKPTKFREINYKILVRILATPKIIFKV